MQKILIIIFILLITKTAFTQNSYCVPISNCTSEDIITNVTFNSINRASECDGSETDGYSFYTYTTPANTTTVRKGNSYALTVSTGMEYAEGVAAWIDYNQNNTFESNEKIFSGFIGVEGAVYTTSVTIPNSATSGVTRLRIRCNFNDNIDDPCLDIDYGETEDYLITINSETCTPPTVTISGNTTGCDSLTLTASGGTSYLWSGGTSPNSASNTFTESGKYYVQVTNATGCTSVDSQTVNVTPAVTPFISIYSNPYSTTICKGKSVQFNINYTSNEGTAPTYQWTINSKIINGATSTSYTTDSLENNDTVRCILTSNATCANLTTVSSDPLVFSVLQVPPKPEITIVADDTSICSGTTVTFTSSVTNGGTLPSYQWQKNGVNISGATNSIYNSTDLANNDFIKCIYINNVTCQVGDTSNTVRISVTSSVTPSIRISSPLQTSCFTSNIKNYSFSSLAGAYPEDLSEGSTTLISSGEDEEISNKTEIGFTFIYGGIIYNSFHASSNGFLGLGDTITESDYHNTYSFEKQIMPYWDDLYTINSGVRYKIIGGAGKRKLVVEWNVRHYSVSNSIRIFQVWLFENTNVIQFVYGSNVITYGSATIGIAKSANDYLNINSLNNNVDSSVRYDENVWPASGTSYLFSPCNNNTVLCSNTAVTFTATTFNEGTTPAYQWLKNGNIINGANSPDYTTSMLQSHDTISCTFTSNVTCATSPTALSNKIIIDSVASAFIPTVQISATFDSINQGNLVTFTATPTYGGSSPLFQWKVNGVNKANASTYTTSDLKHHDTVTCQLTSNLSCASPSIVLSNAIIINVDYCIPYNSSTSNSYYISKVTFDSIHRSSTFEGSSSGGYSYYNTDSNTTRVHKGNNYAFSVTIGPYQQAVAAWIDFNRNNVFDTSESVLSAFRSAGNITYDTSVTIPTSAKIGPTRLRVRSAYYSNVLLNNSCGEVDYGETEDYLIYVDSVPCTPPIINITGDSTACDTVRLTAAGGQAYFWSGGLITNNAENKFVTSSTYSVQVTDSLGCTSTKAITVKVETSLKPEISVTPNDTNLICSSIPVIFTATATNVETSAIYRWIKNGITLVDTLGNKYKFGSLKNNDTIICIVYNKCQSDTSAVFIARIVSGVQPPGVSITVSPADTINYGNTATFRALPVLGGSSPAYHWKVNGINVGSNSATYTSSSLVNKDTVNCILTSSAVCATPQTAISNTISIRVGYCIPTITNTCDSEYISNVTFNTIHRNSACDGAYSYFDRDTNSTVVHKGNNYTLTVKTIGYVGAAAWIDYNQNRIFETNERVLASYSGDFSPFYTTNFSIPATALTGTTRLRIRCSYNSNPGNTSCGNVSWGETEDYLLTIDSAAADLIVDSLKVPSNGFQNRPISISWQVKNKGEGATKTGTSTDRVYISASPVFSPGSALMQYDFVHNGILYPDSSYTQTREIQLPDNIAGKFYVHVFTDAGLQITEYETGGENNNVKISDSIHIYATMPADLVVTGVISSPTGSAGQKITASWTVKNQGDTAINTSNWVDSVYISSFTTFDFSTAIALGGYPHAGGLSGDSSYTTSAQVTLPKLATEIYYIYVFANARKNAAEYDYNNNSKRSNLLQVFIPDLQPLTVIPTVLSGGAQLNLIWQDKNVGTGIIENLSWTDRIYLSYSYPLDTTNAFWFDVRFTSQTINSTFSANRNITLNLPDLISGRYYLFVRTDLSNEVFENSEVNNTSFGGYFQLQTNFPLTDIGVSQLVSPLSSCGLTSQETINARIKNHGNLKDSVLSIGFKLDNNPIVSENVTGVSIYPGGYLDYTFSTKANLSATGTHTLKIFTIFANDTIRSNDTLTTIISNFPALDSPKNLLPMNGTADLNKPVNFSWSAVQNASKYDLFIWKETDTMPSTPVLQDLTQINYSYQGAPLAFGQKFKWKVNAKSGTCVTSSATQIFEIRYLPDLTVDSIAVPAEGGISETSFVVSWRVKRKDGAPIPNGWKDYVYLTESATNPASGLLLGIFDNVTSLNTDTVYSRNNVSFYIPQGYEGNYYIAVITDYANAVTETIDTNNTRLIPFYITLNDYPDLIVDSLIVSRTDAFSGDTINVSWRVKNIGEGPTPLTNWEDRIYVNKDDTLIIPSNLPPVASVTSPTIILVKDSFYVKSAKIALPQHVQDTFYVHIWTDPGTKVYEYVKDSNNSSTSEPINITMRANPDLTINNITVSADTVSNNQTVTVQWTTKNEGAATAFPAWYDRIRMIADTSNTYNSTVFSNDYSQQNSLQSLSATGKQANIQIPYSLPEGKYYFYAISDIFDNVYEDEVNENNNVSPYSNPMYVVNPDLSPIAFQVPDTAYSKENINVSWIMKNIGKGGIYNTSWNDHIYYSDDNSFDALYDTDLGSVSNNFLLLKDQQYNNRLTVKLPRGISGRKYLFLVPDYGNSIFEKNESNNIRRDSIFVKLSPYPDLSVTDIQHAATDTAGTSITFSYAVENFGKAGIISKTWSDRFYLSPTNNANDFNRVYLTSKTNTLLSVDTSQTYINTITATIPSYLSGNYYIVAETNYANDIYEYTADTNNIRVSATPVSITKLPNVNLMAVSGTATGSFFAAGKPLTFQWTGVNAGTTTTIITSWQDAVYLSNNQYLDASDSLIGTWSVNTSLTPGASYTQTHSATIPVNATGTLYFIVNIDKNNTQNDNNRSNNSLVLQTILVDTTNPGDTGVVVGEGGGIIITPVPSADLIPVSFTLSSPAGISGQPLTAYFTVKNNDTAATNSAKWYDRIRLSADNQLSWDDPYLGGMSHSGILNPGAQYSDSITFNIPYSAAGNYYVLFETDASGHVYENQKENNNTAYNSILIQPQEPGDLIVTRVIPPAGIYYPGQLIFVNYTLKNIGTKTTSAYHNDAFYLSKDSIWDINDVLLGTRDIYSSITPQDTASNVLYARLVNITKGNYYVIVRTDILSNIYETNESNNTGVSPTPMEVDVKVLTMNVTAVDSILNNENLYYRINIPDSLRGETMLLTLKGDSAHHAVNRLYLKYADAPSGNNYDFVSEIPYQANQNIIVPVLQGGDYYILTSGNDTATYKQPVTLLATIIPFAITQVDANQGGNTGAVTIKINGAKFDSTTNFYLRSDTNGVIYPSKIYYNSSTQVFATYNLLNAKIGWYDVIAKRLNGDSAEPFKNGFEIIQGNGSTAGDGIGTPGTGTGFVCQITNIGFEDQLETTVLHPASTRPRRFVVMTIYYENTGNVDIPSPTRFIVSLKDSVPLGFTPDEFDKKYTTLALDFEERGGPPGILRPGANGFIKVYTIGYDISIGSLDFTIIE